MFHCNPSILGYTPWLWKLPFYRFFFSIHQTLDVFVVREIHPKNWAIFTLDVAPCLETSMYLQFINCCGDSHPPGPGLLQVSAEVCQSHFDVRQIKGRPRSTTTEHQDGATGAKGAVEVWKHQEEELIAVDTLWGIYIYIINIYIYWYPKKYSYSSSLEIGIVDSP